MRVLRELRLPASAAATAVSEPEPGNENKCPPGLVSLNEINVKTVPSSAGKHI